MSPVDFLQRNLHNRSGLIRKGAAFALRAPRRLARAKAKPADYASRPPVLANSFPKSGTHLLDQILEALPARRNYGEFLSSMTSSFRFQRRTSSESAAALRTAIPGELVRSHLFFATEIAEAVVETGIVHYFIYRDPRDVVLSEAHYLRSLNRWHRLHPFFRDAPSLDAAIELSIRGIPEKSDSFYYPPIGERFEQYAPWIQRDDVFAVRFEDLVSDQQPELLRQIADYYAARSATPMDIDAVVAGMRASVDPERSHTYRKGRSGGWREKFTTRHRDLFREYGGDVLDRYGFDPFEG
ncbi:MAG: sulfotransferase domain-containing protein [Planctomycetales bacterium]|nr:sulfotransferase domain-containing protein [Planctomycetales bacterium]